MSKTLVNVPDYYPKFQCKCGDCRSTCCSGWGICFSMEEYFRLLGLPASDELRHRIDGTMSLLPDATPERYAQLNPNWLGRCPMQREDGHCALQRELGEEVLPKVCRLYPRGLRTAFDTKCSCSNSCEAVIEQFFNRTEPLRFLKMEMEGNLPQTQEVEPPYVAKQSRAIRDYSIAMLQDRSFPLWERLQKLGIALHTALTEHDLSCEFFESLAESLNELEPSVSADNVLDIVYLRYF